MSVWVPERYRREREQFNAEVWERIVSNELSRMKGVMDKFNYELKKIDRHLELVRIAADADVRGTPFRAGFYHVVRMNPGAPASVMVVEGDMGEFVEPSSRLFDDLARADLWKDGNMKALQDRQRKLDEAEARERQRENEARRDELLERVKAVTETSVSMNTSTPWSQNVNGKRGAGKKKAGDE